MRRGVVSSSSNIDIQPEIYHISKQIIVTEYLGDRLKSMLLNKGQMIAEYLNTNYHGKYLIFNLSQMNYDGSKFDNNVMSLGWIDNYNPTMNLLFSIIKTMHKWLSSSPDNVVVLHSLNSIGRVGTVVVSYLLYSKQYESIEDALRLFAMKRSILNFNASSVIQSPSQLAYIHYFYKIISKEKSADSFCNAPPLFLNTIYIRNAPHFIMDLIGDDKFSLEICHLTVPRPNESKLVPLVTCKKLYSKGSRSVTLMAFKCNVLLYKDIVIVCNSASTLYSEELFRFGFHTSFIENNSLKKIKKEMDSVQNNALFEEKFTVELKFDAYDEKLHGSKLYVTPDDSIIYQLLADRDSI